MTGMTTCSWQLTLGCTQTLQATSEVSLEQISINQKHRLCTAASWLPEQESAWITSAVDVEVVYPEGGLIHLYGADGGKRGVWGGEAAPNFGW